jgi:hypothetical protein
MAWFVLELLYARAADIVLAHAQPGDTLCAGDIGTLGYVTDLPVLDTVGLITPQSRAYYPADPDIYIINYALPADLVLALDPDFVVILEVYGRRGLLPAARFQARYQLLEKLRTDIYGSDQMLIFERVVGSGSRVPQMWPLRPSAPFPCLPSGPRANQQERTSASRCDVRQTEADHKRPHLCGKPSI